MGFTFFVSATRVSPSHQATVSPSQGLITAGACDARAFSAEAKIGAIRTSWFISRSITK
jgi:hypothetical protein